MAEEETVERRRIVVAVDESEESMFALSWCLGNLFAKNTESSLFLVHAKPPTPVCSSLDGTGFMLSKEAIAAMEKYRSDLAHSVMKRAESICKDFPSIMIVKKVRSGDARDVICRMTEKLGADILVMGSHGYGFIKRALLGSVSDHCAKNVKCPVVIVKHPKT